MKKLPIGIQTFRKIREGNYVYVDKTKELLNIIENYQYVFLSRPRRFGKSLFLDTLKEVFEGNKELFKGLYIYDKYDFEKYPVIKISWSGSLKSLKAVNETAHKILKQNQRLLNVECDNYEFPENCFADLIQKTYERYRKPVVILIDEYDKPILDNIENIEKAKEIREFLREFYTVIKDNDAYIRFAFLTGVSRFSRVSIFSGLNNLEDISLNPDFAYICGFIHRDLQTEFKDYLEGIDLEQVRKWYNGYNFLGEEKVYNPFDILLFLRNKEFNNYWFKSGTPTFLIKLLEKRNYNTLEFENLQVSSSILDSFDIENIEVETIMFQAGYLTIKKVIEIFGSKTFTLTFPNLEVRKSFNDYLLDYLTENKGKKEKTKLNLIQVLLKAALDKLKDVLTSIYASIPYQLFIKKDIRESENYYQVILYMYLAGCGIDVIAEDNTDKGRIDLTAIVVDKVYIFEFKTDEKQEPLNQVIEKKYFEKYLNHKSVYIVGIQIDKKNRNVKSVVWKKIKWIPSQEKTYLEECLCDAAQKGWKSQMKG